MLTLASQPERLQGFQARHGDLARVHYGTQGVTPWDGCLAGHRQIWQQLDGDTLVLEDDAILVPGWQQVLAGLTVPEDWDLLYLGGQHFARPEQIAPGLLRCTKTTRTHAYVVRAQSVPRLLAATDRPDHVSNSLAAAQQSGMLVAYAVYPWLAGQAAGFSTITGRQEPERWWGPRASG